MREIVAGLLEGHGWSVPVLAFLVLGALVFAVASRLARYADTIADATGLGRLWIGALLLAASTSLPELSTDINAALLGAVDIGVGDLFGSTLSNLLVLAGIDIAWRRREILHGGSPNHALVGSLAILLTTVAATAIASGGFGRVGHVGIESLLILLLYVVGMRAVFFQSMPTAPPEQLELGATSQSLLRRGVLRFALAAAALLLIAPLLVLSAEALAHETGASLTLIGTLLVGFTTSFPEIAASIAAMRMGAKDLAVGNLMGSNAFNLCVLAVMDFFYLPGPLAAAASQEHARTALFAVMALAFCVLALQDRRGLRAGPLRVASVGVLAAYAGCVLALSGVFSR